MSRDVVSRFRITVRPWPEQLFPVAAVDHPAHVSVDEEGRLHDSQPYGLKELPPEAVLRELFDADLDEPVGVVAFLSELGWTNRGNEDLRLAQLEYDHPRHPKEPSAQLVWSTRTTTAFEIVSDNPEIEVGIREHFPLMWWEVARATPRNKGSRPALDCMAGKRCMSCCVDGGRIPTWEKYGRECLRWARWCRLAMVLGNHETWTGDANAEGCDLAAGPWICNLSARTRSTEKRPRRCAHHAALQHDRGEHADQAVRKMRATLLPTDRAGCQGAESNQRCPLLFE